MVCPSSLSVALKEWAIVCRALEAGRQTLLLRKGGIYESAGEFQLEHRAFLLFPTYLHQKAEMLKPGAREGLESRDAEPTEVRLTAAGVVTDIVPITSRMPMEALDAEHVWAPPLIDMRFNYRPDNPLYVLLVRAYRLQHPLTIDNTPAYAGCKSWVPLESPVETRNAAPVLDDAKYETRRSRILEHLRQLAE